MLVNEFLAQFLKEVACRVSNYTTFFFLVFRDICGAIRKRILFHVRIESITQLKLIKIVLVTLSTSLKLSN